MNNFDFLLLVTLILFQHHHLYSKSIKTTSSTNILNIPELNLKLMNGSLKINSTSNANGNLLNKSNVKFNGSHIYSTILPTSENNNSLYRRDLLENINEVLVTPKQNTVTTKKPDERTYVAEAKLNFGGTPKKISDEFTKTIAPDVKKTTNINNTIRTTVKQDAIPIEDDKTSQDNIKPCSPEKGVTCYNCETIEYCDNHWNNNRFEAHVTRINCGKQTNGERQYCDSQINKCVTENTCKNHSVHEIQQCQNVGPQPDPLDCTRYVNCQKDKFGYLQKYVRSCPFDSPVYNPKLEKCGFYKCTDMSQLCDDKQKAGTLIAFKPLPKIYGKCPADNEDSKEINLFVCQRNHTFNERSASCEPKCEEEGYIRSNDDCRSFYTCNKRFFGYSLGVHTCPAGFGFNVDKGHCDILPEVCDAAVDVYSRALSRHL